MTIKKRVEERRTTQTTTTWTIEPSYSGLASDGEYRVTDLLSVLQEIDYHYCVRNVVLEFHESGALLIWTRTEDDYTKTKTDPSS